MSAAAQELKSPTSSPSGIRAAHTPDRTAAASLVERVQSVQALIVDVGPALALALLERNTHNRRISDGRVEVYARDMIAGRWELNNQGIALGRDGELYDGQHRLLAIVHADVTVPMLIVSGLPPTARSTIDQGRARTIADVMRIVDGQPNGARVVAWFRSVELLTTGQRLPLSHGIVQEQLAKYDSSVKWFVANVPRRRDLTRASVIGALLYAHRVVPADVERFIGRYLTGIGLTEGSPALALRNYVAQRMNGQGETPRVASLRTLRCLLGDIRGDIIERVSSNEDAFEHFRSMHDERDRLTQP